MHCPLLAIYSIWKHRTTSHVQRSPTQQPTCPVLHNLTHLHRFPRCLLFLLSLRVQLPASTVPRALPHSLRQPPTPSPTMNSLATQNYPHPTQCTKRAPLAVAPTAEQRQTNVVKALQGKMADFISGSSQRHYRTIVRELSDRQIPLNLLSDESKAKGLAQMLEEDVCSLSELVILGQFAKAIDDSDTRAAEFLRDTAGYKPQTDVTVEHKTQGLASLTDTQLLTLLQALNPEQSDEVSNG